MMLLTTEALAVTQPDLLLASSGLSLVKKGTTTSPLVPAAPLWMWDMMASKPVHFRSKQISVPRILTAAVPLPLGSPPPTSLPPASLALNLVQAPPPAWPAELVADSVPDSVPP
jgi:hypothetical protein